MNIYYIVQGSTGEYSDRIEWPVRIFKSQEEAEEFIQLLENEYRQFPQTDRGWSRDEEDYGKLESVMRRLDPNFCEDYTGTYYYLGECQGDF